MKPSRCLVSILGAVGLAATAMAAEPAPSPAPAAARPPEPILIANLTQSVPGVFSYASWQDNYAYVPNTGLHIQGAKGAQGHGGLGRNVEPAVDLSQTAFIEVALAVQGGNELGEFTVALNDADGTQCAARVRVGQIMPGPPVWYRLRRTDFVPVAGQEGKDRAMDWSKIGQWHLQGDWSTRRPASVVLIALRARS